MKRTLMLGLLVVLVVSLGVLNAQDKTTGQVEKRTEAPQEQKRNPQWYRVELSVHEVENGKKINTRSYGLGVEEDSWSSIRIGGRWPFTAGPSNQVQYVDITMNVRCRIDDIDGKIALNTHVDFNTASMESGTEPQLPKGTSLALPITSNVSSDTITQIAIGKATNLATMDDPIIRSRKFQVEATVTRANP